MVSATLKMMVIGNSSSANKALKEVGDQAEKTEGKFKGVGKIAAGVFGGEALFEGAKKVGEFFKEGIEKSAEFSRDFASLSSVMKRAGVPDEVIEAQEKYLTSMSNTVGVAKEDLLPAYQKTFAATGNVAKAHKALSAALDLAAGAHISLNAAVKAVDTGLGGSEGALKKYGVQAKNAGDVTDMISKKFGGAAVASTKTFGGEINRLKIMFDNFQESLGAKVLPYLTKFGDWFVAKGLPVIKSFALELKAKLTPAFNAVASFISNKVVPAIEHQLVPGVRSAIAWLGPKITPTLKALWQVFKTDIVPILNNLWHTLKDKVVPAIKPLVALLLKVTPPVLKIAGAILKQGVPALIKFWSTAIVVEAKMIGFIAKLVEGGIKVGRFAADVVGAIRGIPGKIGGSISKAISSAGKLAGPFKTVYSAIQDVVREIGRISSAIANVSLGKLGSIVSDVGKVAGKIPGLAVGTKFAPGGLAIVGERGPELVNLPRGSRVHTAAATARILAAAGSPKDIAPVSMTGGRSRSGGVVHNHYYEINGTILGDASSGREILRLVRKAQRTSGAPVTV